MSITQLTTESYAEIQFKVMELRPNYVTLTWQPVGGDGLTSYLFKYYPTECSDNQRGEICKVRVLIIMTSYILKYYPTQYAINQRNEVF